MYELFVNGEYQGIFKYLTGEDGVFSLIAGLRYQWSDVEIKFVGEE